MPDTAKEKPGKKHQHADPIKVGDKFVCPKCGVEVPVNKDCPHCKVHIDWTKV